MKLTTCLLFASIICPAAFADEYLFDETSFPETLACSNGNDVFVNVGNYPVTPSKWIKLSTNSNYMVVCQIAYENTAFENGPSSADEIVQVRQVENCLNLGLLKFLQEKCNGKSDKELVRSYHDGAIRGKIRDDFAKWFDDNVNGLLKTWKEESNVLILGVSIRAVGPFAKALEE